MKHAGRPPGSAIARGMRFARWALAKPKPPSVEDVMNAFDIDRSTARQWRTYWLQTGPHAVTPIPHTETTP